MVDLTKQVDHLNLELSKQFIQDVDRGESQFYVQELEDKLEAYRQREEDLVSQVDDVLLLNCLMV